MTNDKNAVLYPHNEEYISTLVWVSLYRFRS